MDQTGAYALEHAVEKWQAKGTKVFYVGMQDHIRETLTSTGSLHKLDEDDFFSTFESAIRHISILENKSIDQETGQGA
jgi:anti-anti-sigma regulatory factor